MRLVAGTLSFIAASVCAAVALAFFLGGLSPQVAVASLAIGMAAGLVAWWTSWEPDPPRPTAWDVALLTVFALASLRAFLWLIYPAENQWRVLSPYNLGDLSKHIQIIEYLAHGARFWPSSPFFHQGPLAYYFGTDLFNALLVCMGAPLTSGLVWTGLAAAALTAWTLWRWGGAFAIACLIFNGGLAGLILLHTGRIDDFQSELAWKNLFLTMFVPQRALLYALPAAVFLLCVWRARYFRGSSPVPRWIPWLIYTSMPVFSLHAFGFLSLVLAAVFVARPEFRGALFRLVATAFIPASILVFFVTGGFTQEAGATWHPGWMQGDPQWTKWLSTSFGLTASGAPAAILFWLVNFGIALPLLAALVVRIIRTRNAEAAAIAGPAIIVFAACCLFKFAAWEWDNTKFFIWAWLAAAPYLGAMIFSWPPPARVAVCFLLFFSGALSLVGGLDGRHGYTFIDRAELDATRYALRNVPPMDRIATTPTYNNPVVLLGRPVVCGYEGMLWAHGLHYQDSMRALNDILTGNDPLNEKARQVGASWIYVSGGVPVPVK